MKPLIKDSGDEISGDLFAAWRNFRRGKKPNTAIDEFAYNLTANLARLADEIERREYRHGGYRRVVVEEKKRRDLAVAAVRDRVVHRLVYDELVEIFDAKFDPDAWSCRKDMGLHKCLTRTQQLLTKHHANFVWRMDVAKFFDRVDHAKLREALRRRVQDPRLLYPCDELLDSYNCQTGGGGQGSQQPPHGIPIGNLTSQIFANIYLNEFDRYVRHVLKPQAYVRYGDDAALFCRTRAEARAMRQTATKFLREELKLAVNPKNDVIIRADQPLHFLGHVITDKYAVVDKHTTRSVMEKVNIRNIASYKSLNLAKWPKRQIDYLLLDEIEKTIDNHVEI
ncbi:reverse transcriptase/maturase family protein [Candidatus Saccharibacteria bacterium]|nr:reverse transcriptase/maturase family protein [Candidatus Saccharibacteria bacterium]